MGAKKGLIFGSRACESWDFLGPYAHWPDVVIAADGGIHCARSAGFRPNVYIGDDDSGGSAELGLTCVQLPVEKDVTDLEAAYTWARDHGIKELIFTGCTGGRLDHHMSAMALLERAARDGVDALLMNDGNRVRFLLPGEYRFARSGYKYFSLIPVDRMLERVTITGAKYPLKDRDVPRGSSLTVSNEFVAETVNISFTGGCCYFIEAE